MEISLLWIKMMSMTCQGLFVSIQGGEEPLNTVSTFFFDPGERSMLHAEDVRKI